MDYKLKYLKYKKKYITMKKQIINNQLGGNELTLFNSRPVRGERTFYIYTHFRFAMN